MSRIKRSAFIFCGFLCVGLGLLGVFIPVLPTTPLILLAAFCFGRGSDRFHQWLVNNSWASSYILNYQSGRGIPLKQKVASITFLWLTIGISIGFTSLVWWLKVIIFIIAIGVTNHLVRMKTFQD